MAVDDSAALAGFIALAAEERERRAQALAGLLDVRTVTGVAGRQFTVRALNGSADATLPVLGHVTAVVDDEVLVARIGRGWVVIGNITQAPGSGGGGGGGGSTAWGAITGTLGDQTDLQAVLDTIPDPAGDGVATTYARSDHEHAGAGASSVALGPTASAAGVGAMALGSGTVASNDGSFAIGQGADALADYAFAIGSGAGANLLNALAIGTEAFAESERSVAIGRWAWVRTSALGSLALGANTTVGIGSTRSFALGYGASVPASTPDTGVIKANDVQQVRSDGTGVTRYGLLSPDGTIGWITVTDTDGLVVNSNPLIDLASWGAKIAALTNTAIDNADSFVFSDASDSGNAKRVTWSSLLVTLLGSFQTLDSDLTAIAGLSPSNDDVIQRKAGAWTNRTMAQLKSDLALTNVENVAQSNRGIDLTLGPFYANDLAASSDVEGQYGFFNTATAVSQSGNGQRITRSGKVVGVIATTDAARTGGTLTVRPRINGSGNSGITAVIDGTNTTSNSTFSQTGVSFSANDTIDVSFLTSSWGPTTADATAWLVLRLNDF